MPVDRTEEALARLREGAKLLDAPPDEDERDSGLWNERDSELWNDLLNSIPALIAVAEAVESEHDPLTCLGYFDTASAVSVLNNVGTPEALGFGRRGPAICGICAALASLSAAVLGKESS